MSLDPIPPVRTRAIEQTLRAYLNVAIVVGLVGAPRRHVRCSVAGQVNRNVAPAPTSDSTHACPPTLSTIRRTIERPMPVVAVSRERTVLNICQICS